MTRHLHASTGDIRKKKNCNYTTYSPSQVMQFSGSMEITVPSSAHTTDTDISKQNESTALLLLLPNKQKYKSKNCQGEIKNQIDLRKGNESKQHLFHMP